MPCASSVKKSGPSLGGLGPYRGLSFRRTVVVLGTKAFKLTNDVRGSVPRYIALRYSKPQASAGCDLTTFGPSEVRFSLRPIPVESCVQKCTDSLAELLGVALYRLVERCLRARPQRPGPVNLGIGSFRGHTVGIEPRHRNDGPLLLPVRPTL